MSYTINHGTVTGRLTRDADIRTTNSGKTVASFSLAVDRSQKNVDGGWEKIASFFKVAFFCHEKFAHLLTKGTAVAVDYELRQERWEDKKTGQNRSEVVLFAHNVLLMGSGKREGNPDAEPSNESDYQKYDGGYDKNATIDCSGLTVDYHDGHGPQEIPF